MSKLTIKQKINAIKIYFKKINNILATLCSKNNKFNLICMHLN